MDPNTIKLASNSLPKLWNFSDPKQSGERFRCFKARADSVGNAVLGALAATQLARALGLERRFDEGFSTLDSIDLGLSDPRGELEVRRSLEHGRLLNSSGKRSESVPHFERAWDAANESGLDGLAVDAAHMLGIVEHGDAGQSWNQRALDLAMSSDQPDARKWRGSLLNNIAWSLHEAGEHERALELFNDAFEVRVQEGTPTSIRIARWSVGRCLRSLGRVVEALKIQRELESDPNADGYVFEEIAECLLAQSKAQDAKPYFSRAHAMLSADPWLVANESDRLSRLAQLGADLE